MKNTKSFLSLLLCFAVIFGVFGFSRSTSIEADAEDGVIYGCDLTWNYDESTQTLTIDGTGNMIHFSRSFYEDVSRTYAPWGEKYYNSIKTVIIGDGVINIGADAFYGCSGIESVTIGKSVTRIDSNAFHDCASLETIYISESINFISGNAFNGCSGLKNITVADGNAVYRSSGNCIIEKDSGTLVCGCNYSVIPDDGSVKAIGEHAFACCEGLTDLTIPDSVETLEWAAFFGCPDLISVTIGSSVKKIGEMVFNSCDSLEYLTVDDNNTAYRSSGNCIINTERNDVVVGCKNSVIPDDGSITGIYGESFRYCRGLTELTIPEGVTYIGSASFEGCSGLKKITFPDSVTQIGSGAFERCSSLTDISIPDGVTFIQSDTFYGCSSLTSVIIPDSVTGIGPGAFHYCTGLKCISFGKSLKQIDYLAFCGCSGLTTLTFPDGLWYIGEEAFDGCTGLTSIILPASVTVIEDGAFSFCPSLMFVYYSGNENDRDKIRMDGSCLTVIWLYNCSGEETENDFLRTRLINGNSVSKEKTYDYKTTVTFSVTVPKGGVIQWFVNDEPAGNDETLTVKEKTSDYTVSIIYTDKNGKQIYDEEKVIIKNGFFDKIIWFFKHLFVPGAYNIKQ